VRAHARTTEAGYIPRRGTGPGEVCLRVAFTIDLEPDCPPWLTSHFRGVDEGMPRVMALLQELEVPATVFTTGDVARRSPALVHAVREAGHTVGCHGQTHAPFDRMDHQTAREEIATSLAILRAICGAGVTAFRAPYLRFPDRFLPLLTEAGITLDASGARYKRGGGRRAGMVDTPSGPLRRIPASVTSSVLRAPDPLRWPWLRALADPVVLFVHPWEFVDLRRAPIRWDCRFRTGDTALAKLREVLTDFRARGATFVQLDAL
jgi:peptidoglycan/xylan/chitin deacetylase (PgdA/CDA1 family)